MQAQQKWERQRRRAQDLTEELKRRNAAPEPAGLDATLAAVDLVMCPTDWVSHNAYYQLKRQCKHSGKPCLLFKGAGVSGFAVALARLSSGRVSRSGDPIEPSWAMAER